MIVNTAYPFMAKTKKLFTHLFENGKSNYPTDFAAGVILNESGLYIPRGGVKAAFLEIPLSKFKTLNFSGHGSQYGNAAVEIAIQKPSGETVAVSSTYSLSSISSGGSKFAYRIVPSLQIDGYTIAFYSTESGFPTITDAFFDV